MNPTAYIVLAQNIIIAVSYSFSLYVATKLLQKKFQFELTPTFKAYLGYIIFLSLASLISCGYVLVNWRPNDAKFDSKFLYIVTIIPGLISGNNLISEIFLCLERCFIVAFSFNYKECEKLVFAFISILITVSAIMGQFFFDGYFFAIPESFPTSCFLPSCITNGTENNGFLTMKIIFGGINITAAVFLGLIIKFKLQSNASTSKLNYTVVITIFLTLIFEFFPSFLAKWYKSATGSAVPSYFGRYATTLSAINVAICMFLYFKTIKKLPAANNFAKIVPSKFFQFKLHFNYKWLMTPLIHSSVSLATKIYYQKAINLENIL